MKKKSLAIAAAAVAVGGLAIAGPAMATGTNYKVDIGGLPASAGNQTLTATTPTSATAVQFSTPTSPTLNCTNSKVDTSSPVSTVTNSPATNVLNLATLNKVQFTGCTLNGTALTVTQNNAWYLHGVNGATNAATDTVNGHVDNVSAFLSASNPNICSFTVTGKADGSYSEAGKSLAVNETGYDGDLKVSGVKGCGGVLSNGQSANFRATYAVTVGGSSNYTVNVKP